MLAHANGSGAKCGVSSSVVLVVASRFMGESSGSLNSTIAFSAVKLVTDVATERLFVQWNAGTLMGVLSYELARVNLGSIFASESILSSGSSANTVVTGCSWESLVGCCILVMAVMLFSFVSSSSDSSTSKSRITTLVGVMLSLLAFELGLLFLGVLLTLITVYKWWSVSSHNGAELHDLRKNPKRPPLLCSFFSSFTSCLCCFFCSFSAAERSLSCL